MVGVVKGMMHLLVKVALMQPMFGSSNFVLSIWFLSVVNQVGKKFSTAERGCWCGWFRAFGGVVN